MKKVLLISMYYEPLNLIPVTRIKMFRDALIEGGNRVDVITRNYSSEQLLAPHLGMATETCLEELIVNDDHGDIYYLKFNTQGRKKKISKLMPPGIRGRYNMHQIDVFHHDFYDNLIHLLETKKNKYDTIFLSYGPPIILKLARYFIEKSQARVILDFRDSYITEQDSGYLLNKKIQILDSILPKVDLVSAASSGIISFLKRSVKSEFQSKVILNGVIPEEETREISTTQEYKNTKSIIALHAGSLYPGQDMSYFEKLLGTIDHINIEPILLGVNHDFQGLSKFKRLPKVGPSEAYRYCKRADLLLLPVWRDRYTGFSGKLLTYLHSGTHILCGPDPQEDLKEILMTSKNAHILTGNILEDQNLIKALYKIDFKSLDYDKSKYEARTQYDKILELL